MAIAAVPVLTSALSPGVGDNYYGYKVDTNAVNISLTGINQTWDIPSTSIASGSFTNYIGETVSNTPYNSTFSVTSSIAVKDFSLSSYTYYITSASQLNLSGYADVAGITNFSDPATIITFPFTYNDIVNDNLTGTLKVGIATFSIIGTTATIADSYGTLILPSGTYDVLRLKVDQNIVASNIGGSITSHFTTYYWYSASHKYPLMQVDIIQTSGSGVYSGTADSYEKKAYILTPQLLSVDERYHITNFNFYPNPANGVGNISFFIGQQVDVVGSIINIIGQESIIFSEKNIQPGNHNKAVDLHGLPKGIYHLKLAVNGRVSQQKIIIQ